MAAPNDMRAFNRAIIEEFRANNGLVGHEALRGARIVLLTTTGVRTGKPHTTPLGDLGEEPGRTVLWASNLGAAEHPAWYRNLLARPEVVLERRTPAGVLERVEGRAVTATGQERERLLAALRASRPEIAAHQDRTDREIPLVVVS
ncbi:nitroreductase/quinone reductase family protein [Kutzneria albida]|uniref:Nitroreductase family deazaflavin-dependent oxidoreductase n=1 Tax=Kutzneria albida DSM 43870 TaxID=1449976 RepID=W5WGM1_9PSEU|nr:nitroreductase/quinone reductase family protein [Kutzneria albida]AHH99900.1 hypothetical protein KALB_6541 [Kutzneria albida DSM 43870]